MRRSQTTSPRSPRRPTALSPTSRSAFSTGHDTELVVAIRAAGVASDSCLTEMWPVRSWPPRPQPELICWLASVARPRALAACALRCLGEMLGRLIARNDESGPRPRRRLRSDRYSPPPSYRQRGFVATGVTDGSLLRGVRFESHRHRDPFAVNAVSLGHHPVYRGSAPTRNGPFWSTPTEAMLSSSSLLGPAARADALDWLANENLTSRKPGLGVTSPDEQLLNRGGSLLPELLDMIKSSPELAQPLESAPSTSRSKLFTLPPTRRPTPGRHFGATYPRLDGDPGPRYSRGARGRPSGRPILGWEPADVDEVEHHHKRLAAERESQDQPDDPLIDVARLGST